MPAAAGALDSERGALSFGGRHTQITVQRCSAVQAAFEVFGSPPGHGLVVLCG